MADPAPPGESEDPPAPPWCAAHFQLPDRWSRLTWWVAFCATIIIVTLATAVSVTATLWVVALATAAPAAGSGAGTTRIGTGMTIGLTTVVCMLVIGSCVTFVWSIYRRWEVRRLMAEELTDPRAEALYKAMLTDSLRNGILRWKSRKKWIETARSTGVSTWVEMRLAPVVRAIPRPDAAMEPERLGSYWGSLESRFGTIAVVLSAFYFVQGSMVAGSVWALVALLNLSRLLIRGALFEPVVVGQGWVQHGKARWSVEDSVAYLRVRGGNVQVTVEGPPGMLRANLPLKAGKTAALASFWERWTHPRPRLDQAAFDA